jgi:hypothetical protein
MFRKPDCIPTKTFSPTAVPQLFPRPVAEGSAVDVVPKTSPLAVGLALGVVGEYQVRPSERRRSCVELLKQPLQWKE